MADVQQVKSLSKSEKAAVVLLCMDEKTTSELFNQMQDDEIRKVANALLNLSNIPQTQIQTVLEEFSKGYASFHEKNTGGDVSIDGGRVLENMLSRTLPRNRSQVIMNQLQGSSVTQVVDSDADFKQMISQYGAETLFEIVKEEHPQVISIVLANCKRAVAKGLIELFPEELQPDLITRMAGLTKIAGSAMSELKSYVSQKLQAAKAQGAGEGASKKAADYSIEGMLDTVKLLKSLKRDKSMKLVEDVEKLDAEMGALISKQMFTIEDMERANDVGIRELLRGVTNDDLKVALKNTPDAVKQKFFGNMSKRAAMILQEDMEVMPPLKVEEIEAAQQNILRVAKELIKEEKLVLTDASGGGDEE